MANSFIPSVSWHNDVRTAPWMTGLTGFFRCVALLETRITVIREQRRITSAELWLNKCLKLMKKLLTVRQ